MVIEMEKKLKPMNYDDLSIMKGETWSNERPHYLSVRLNFKSNSDRTTFERKIRQVLNGEI